MIKNKLKSEKGATMLLALFAMMVVLVVSAMVLQSATSAALSHGDSRAQKQASLTVSSAAKLLRDAVEGDCITYSQNAGSRYYDRDDAVPAPLDELLTEWVSLLTETPSRSCCQADFAVESDALQTVQVSMYLTREELLFTLQTEGEDIGYSMSLCFDISAGGSTWRFENAQLIKGDASEAVTQ